MHLRPLAAVGVADGDYVDGHLQAAGFPEFGELERARAVAVGLLDLDHNALEHLGVVVGVVDLQLDFEVPATRLR